jgi:hypothetical protein
MGLWEASMRNSKLALTALLLLVPAVASAHDLAGLRAEQRAIAAQPFSLELYLRGLHRPGDVVIQSLGDKSNRWAQRATLHVCFLDGTPVAQARFMQVATEEVGLTNLTLAPGTPACGKTGAEIHVSFNNGDGYASFVGKQALGFKESTATLNLAGMGQSGNWSASWVGLARHEIGHMLGLLHEHQRPDIDCGFQPNAVIEKLTGWTADEVKTNYDPIVKTKSLEMNAYDQKTIMHYQLPQSYYVAGKQSPCYITAQNKGLSDGDISFLRAWYPMVGAPTNPGIGVVK